MAKYECVSICGMSHNFFSRKGDMLYPPQVTFRILMDNLCCTGWCTIWLTNKCLHLGLRYASFIVHRYNLIVQHTASYTQDTTIHLSPFLILSLCMAGHYFSHPLFSNLFHVVIQLVILHGCLSVHGTSMLLLSDHLVLETSHRSGCVLASSSAQTTLDFGFQGKFQKC